MKELDFLFVTPKAPLTARWYPPPDNIVDINGDKWIVGHRHKTGIPFQVKLMDVSIQIIERYKHLQEDKLRFGKMNYWSMCKKLKTVMEACGIEKSISYHCRRHSFATLALSKGMPIELPRRLTIFRWCHLEPLAENGVEVATADKSAHLPDEAYRVVSLSQ